MEFDKLKSKLELYLQSPHTGNPHDIVERHFLEVNDDLEACIAQSEELLNLMKQHGKKPINQNDQIYGGSPGVITLNLPYFYPILLSVLSVWVYSQIYSSENLSLKEKENKINYIFEGVRRWDTLGHDHKRYEEIIPNRLLPSELPLQIVTSPSHKKGILRKLIDYMKA